MEMTISALNDFDPRMTANQDDVFDPFVSGLLAFDLFISIVPLPVLLVDFLTLERFCG